MYVGFLCENEDKLLPYAESEEWDWTEEIQEKN